MIIADTTNIDPAVLALKEKIARKVLSCLHEKLPFVCGCMLSAGSLCGVRAVGDLSFGRVTDPRTFFYGSPQEKKQEKVKVISKKVRRSDQCIHTHAHAAVSLLRSSHTPFQNLQAYRELKKKQQGLLSLKAEGAEVATEEVEPNAPLYCFCRRVRSVCMGLGGVCGCPFGT